MIYHKRSQTRLTTADLHSRLYRLYDHLYANARIRTPAGIGKEAGKILHAAMYLEESRPRLYETYNADPAFQFSPVEVRKLTEGEPHFCKSIAQKVRQGFEAMNLAWRFYENGTIIQLEDAEIAYVCSQLNFILISDRTRDVFGDALEVFRGQWAKRESGQFFTDPKVTALAMTLLQFDPRNGDDLVDLSAGTGGFLLAGINHIRHLLEQEHSLDSEPYLIDLAINNIKGQEIDEQVAEIANSTLAMRLAKTHKPFVAVGDSLRNKFSASDGPIRLDVHLCAATDPPFGTKITVKDRTVLCDYELAVVDGKISPRAPDTLFLERNLRILKPGQGRLAIVAPYQILSGPQAYYIREWLLKQAEVIAVVDLPADTFQPHTGTKGALLVLRRRASPLRDLQRLDDKPIFMSVARWIGHDRRGNPVYRKGNDGSDTGEILSDLEEVGKAYEAFLRDEEPKAIHQDSFVVPAQTVLDNSDLRLNASYYKPLQAARKSSHGRERDVHSQSVLLKDVVTRIFYPTRFKRNYVDYYPEAVPFLGGSNITQLLLTSNKWLRHDDAKLEELRVHTGWILVTRSGSTGIISRVPAVWNGFAMSEHIVRIVPDPTKMPPEYIYAFLRSDYAQRELARGIFGSVIDEITPEHIGSIQIPVLPPDTLGIIIDNVKKAETARNEAVVNIMDAVDEINRYLVLSHEAH